MDYDDYTDRERSEEEEKKKSRARKKQRKSNKRSARDGGEDNEDEDLEGPEAAEEDEEEEMAKLDEKIGFMGGGMMAYAIASGMVNRGIVKPNQILASGPHPENLEKWKEMGASFTTENEDVSISWGASGIIQLLECRRERGENTGELSEVVLD